MTFLYYIYALLFHIYLTTIPTDFAYPLNYTNVYRLKDSAQQLQFPELIRALVGSSPLATDVAKHVAYKTIHTSATPVTVQATSSSTIIYRQLCILIYINPPTS